MIKIRLTRVGRKHDPSFRLVATDSRNAPRSGAYLENLGSYNPRANEKYIVNEERVKYWLSQGAQVSDTAHNLLVEAGILKGKKVNVSKKSKKEAPEASAESVKEKDAKGSGEKAPSEGPEKESAGEEKSE